MSGKKYAVPEGMKQAAEEAEEEYLCDGQSRDVCRKVILEAALRWQAENPIVPTHAEVERILEMVQFQGLRGTSLDRLQDFVAMWQRRMYLAPEPEVSEGIKDLLSGGNLDKLIIEAESRGFLRGQKAGAK